MKRIIKKILPGFFIKQVYKKKLLINYIKLVYQDFKQYKKYSSTFVNPSYKYEQLEARIIAHYHVIEKGLSFKDTRLGFGKDIIRNLINILKDFRKRYSREESFSYDNAISVLRKYNELHKSMGYDISWIENELDELSNNQYSGGIIAINQETFFKSISDDFYQFSNSRKSIRHFIDRDVKEEYLIKACELANNAPSACNRQSVRLYIIKNETLKTELLNLQGGNRGFGEQINKLIVIVSDYSVFHGIQERNQGCVDAGIYLMNLLYGLHYYKLGACTLAWYRSPEESIEIKERIGIKENERIIAIIGVGHVPQEFVVAESQRFSINKILKII